uniref:Uncharacterized protein n=1 Tax=Eutreptiella gymnastica TaxID=73025 RepID=A0A7S4LIV6_9EUGL
MLWGARAHRLHASGESAGTDSAWGLWNVGNWNWNCWNARKNKRDRWQKSESSRRDLIVSVKKYVEKLIKNKCGAVTIAGKEIRDHELRLLEAAITVKEWDHGYENLF